MREHIEDYKGKVFELNFLLNEEKYFGYQNEEIKESNRVTEPPTRRKLSSKLKFEKEKNPNEDILNKVKKQKKMNKNHLKVKIKTRNNSFNLSKIFLSLCIMTIFLFMVHAFVYMIFSSRAKLITNLTKVNILSIELWNAYFILQTAVTETILYNNTVKMWNNVDSESFYYEYREIIKNSIIKNLTESLEYDLGNMTQKYQNDLTIVKKILSIF